jgi:hypothetical protein
MDRNIKKPPPPPGLPTINQRVKAMQLAARSHSSGKEESERLYDMGAVKIVLPPPPCKAVFESKIPETIMFQIPMSDDDADDLGARDVTKKRLFPAKED